MSLSNKYFGLVKAEYEKQRPPEAWSDRIKIIIYCLIRIATKIIIDLCAKAPMPRIKTTQLWLESKETRGLYAKAMQYVFIIKKKKKNGGEAKCQ